MSFPPNPQVPPSPLPPEASLLDPTVALSYIAAVTKEIKLGTGIIYSPAAKPSCVSERACQRGRLV